MKTVGNTAVADDSSKVISLEVINGKLSEKKPKLKKDGTPKKTHNNRVTGKSSEVYAFKSKDEINRMIQVLDDRIENAERMVKWCGNSCDYKAEFIARRNKMLFLIGINIGIRASDIRELKWEFFLNPDKTFKKCYIFQPKKTRHSGKYVKLFFNQAVRNAVQEWMDVYPIDSLDEYVFTGYCCDTPITTAMIWQIVKDIAHEADIEQNIGSHSLRKTFGYWCWHDAEDKEKALVILQSIFNHSSTQMTMRYIGIIDDDMEDMFNSIGLGYDDTDETL